MKAIVIQDAPILIPNKEHKNFTESNKAIEEGTIIYGNIKEISGLRKGEPFVYKLFITNQKQIIYLNKIKPMERTEVTLGADSSQTPTLVKLPSVSNLGMRPILGTVVGVALAFYYSKKKGFTGQKKMIHLAIGGVAGFAIGKYLQSQRDVKVKPSK